jgi:hypothetical protein
MKSRVLAMVAIVAVAGVVLWLRQPWTATAVFEFQPPLNAARVIPNVIRAFAAEGGEASQTEPRLLRLSRSARTPEEAGGLLDSAEGQVKGVVIRGDDSVELAHPEMCVSQLSRMFLVDMIAEAEAQGSAALVAERRTALERWEEEQRQLLEAERRLALVRLVRRTAPKRALLAPWD